MSTRPAYGKAKSPYSADSSPKARRIAAAWDFYAQDERARVHVAKHEQACNERTRAIVASLNSISEATNEAT